MPNIKNKETTINENNENTTLLMAKNRLDEAHKRLDEHTKVAAEVTTKSREDYVERNKGKTSRRNLKFLAQRRLVSKEALLN